MVPVTRGVSGESEGRRRSFRGKGALARSVATSAATALGAGPDRGPPCQRRWVAVILFWYGPSAPRRLRCVLVCLESAVQYTVLIQESDEGFAVSVPGLPGCHSQGGTEAEALANITDAIREYREVVQELAASAGARQVAVEV